MGTAREAGAASTIAGTGSALPSASCIMIRLIAAV
jgi:hypothetical protein